MSKSFLEITDEQYDQKLERLEDSYKAFLRCFQFDESIVDKNMLDLADIIQRVEKRRVYFCVFHDMVINEVKEAALIAYWVLKFKPFYFKREKRDSKRYRHINEKFAIYMIFSALHEVGRISINNKKINSYYSYLLYSFRYRSFTIDSMLVLAESISDETLTKQYDKA
jgi:hypothetical protein